MVATPPGKVAGPILIHARVEPGLSILGFQDVFHFLVHEIGLEEAQGWRREAYIRGWYTGSEEGLKAATSGRPQILEIKRARLQSGPPVTTDIATSLATGGQTSLVSRSVQAQRGSALDR